MIDRLLQHYALASALALKARDKFGQAIEAFADCLAALLLCAG
jgi:hypothetical protein